MALAAVPEDLRSNSQHPRGSSHLSVTPILEDLELCHRHNAGRAPKKRGGEGARGREELILGTGGAHL